MELNKKGVFLLISVITIIVIVVIINPTCYQQPPYIKGDGSSIHLINNKNAKDPTWEELQTFLLQDDTDKKYYTSTYVCGDFAERLHNNAEAAGIKAAFVVVKITSMSPWGDLHALNAFQTSDKGLIYIDDTGEDPTWIPISYSTINFGESEIPSYTVIYDKLAFITIGDSLEFVSLGILDSPDDIAYSQYKQKVENYLVEVEDYNLRIDKYNAQVDAWNSDKATYCYRWPSQEGSYYTMLCGFTDTLSYNQLMSDYRELSRRYEALSNTLRDIGYYYWESLGIVETIEVWW